MLQMVVSILRLLVETVSAYPSGLHALSKQVGRLLLGIGLIVGVANMPQWLEGAASHTGDMPEAVAVVVRVVAKTDAFTRWRAHLAITRLEREEMDLRWVIAESEVKQRVAQEVIEALEQERQQMVAGISMLQDSLAAGQPLAEVTGQPILPGDTEARLAELRLALTTLENRLALTREKRDNFAKARGQAQIMRQTAIQIESVLFDQIALLEASGLIRPDLAAGAFAQEVGADLSTMQAQMERTAAVEEVSAQLEQMLRENPLVGTH